jgi:hypothetical protein
MDYFLTLLFLIISCVIGISIALFLKIKSYFWIAIICTVIFVCIELYYNYKILSKNVKNTKESNISIKDVISKILDKPENISLPTGITISANGNLLASHTETDIPNYHIHKPEEGKHFSSQKDLDVSNYLILKNPQPVLSTITPTTTLNATIATLPSITIETQNNSTFEMDKPPFDGLPPGELLSRLNYIYYATANPAKMLNYHDFKTHADIYLDKDGSKLSTNDLKLQTYSSSFYPQLTRNQIDARDCLNEGSNNRSCFQSPQLFHNVKNNFNIMEKGVNLDNVNLIIKEDFSMPMILNPHTRYEPILFTNAPNGNQDKILDQQSNETINLSTNQVDLCTNCKLGICKNDYCNFQNKLFI